MIRRLILLPSLFFTLLFCHAQWKQTSGPGGGNISSFAIQGDSMFVGTFDNGVFFSTNKGANWVAVNNGLTNPGINALAIKGKNLFAGTSTGVFLSTNSGINWTKFLGFPSLACPFAQIDTNLFAGGKNGVYWSTDNGNNWKSVNSGLSNTDIRTLHATGSNLFAGTYGGGLFLSTNYGVSWTHLNIGFANITDHVTDLTEIGNKLFAETESGVYLSINNGSNWTPVNNGLDISYEVKFAVIGSNLFAASHSKGVYLSSDYGSSWNLINNGLGFDTDLRTIAANGNDLFVGAYAGGVYYSNNNGGNWTAVNKGLTLRIVTTLAVNATNLFAGTTDGVFLSCNNGDDWTSVNNGLTSGYFNVLAANGNNLFAGTKGLNSLFLSNNNGTFWTADTAGFGKYNEAQTFTFSGNNSFVGTRSGGIFISTDNGLSWNACNNGLASKNITALASNGVNLFAGTDTAGVFLSTNNGTNWSPINTGFNKPYGGVTSMVVSGSNLFAASYYGVQLTTDSGKTWNLVNNGLTDKYVQDLTVSGSILFAATGFGGVFYSSDNGASWASMNNGFPTPLKTVYCLAVSGNKLFAGTFAGSVFVFEIDKLTEIAKPTTKTDDTAIYPNPFSDQITVDLDIKTDSNVKIILYNVMGQEISTIENKFLLSGNYKYQIDNAPNGISFLRTVVNDFSSTKKLIRVE